MPALVSQTKIVGRSGTEADYMTKQEFLDNLRASLASRVSASLVEENVRYYEDYINTQIRMNRSEEAVIAELGDPRLLARSIADAEKRSGIEGAAQEYAGEGSSDSSSTWNKQQRGKVFHMPLWLLLVLILVVICLIIGVAFSIFSYLAPILIPVLLIVLAFKWIRDT